MKASTTRLHGTGRRAGDEGPNSRDHESEGQHEPKISARSRGDCVCSSSASHRERVFVRRVADAAESSLSKSGKKKERTSNRSRFFFGSAPGTQGMGSFETSRRSRHPILTAQRCTPPNAVPNRFRFSFGLRLVDMRSPLTWPDQAPRRQEIVANLRSVPATPRATPFPILRAPTQVRADGIAFHVAERRQQLLVFLNHPLERLVVVRLCEQRQPGHRPIENVETNSRRTDTRSTRHQSNRALQRYPKIEVRPLF